MEKWPRLVITALCILYFHSIHGQLNNIQFKHLTSNSGLSSSWVKCIAQDQQGFIWVGTYDGLNKYDGYSCEVFYSDPLDSTSLYSNQIFSLFLDDDGTLWVGTSRGVNVYDQTTNTFIRKSAIPKHNIYDISSDGKGNILIGSQELFIYNKKSNEVIRYQPEEDNVQSISNGMVNDIFIDSRKNIWIGTQDGLNLFDIEKGTFKRFFVQQNEENSLIGNDIRSITEDNNNTLWIGTTKGLNSLIVPENNTDSVNFEKYSHDPLNASSLSSPRILSLYCDKLNNLWIGIQNGGLNILPLSAGSDKQKSFLHFKKEDLASKSLSNNTIQCIFEDNIGNIWLGTYAGGVNLYRFNAKQFKIFDFTPYSNKSINNNHVNTFLEDANYVWVGTEGGLNQYNKKTQRFKYFIHEENNPKSLGANAVWTIRKDIYGKLWIGVWNGGLSKFDSKTGQFKSYQHDPLDSNSIGNNNIRYIYPDKDGDLWIGTMGGGLSHFNTKTQKFKNYNINNSSIKTNYVASIIEYTDGKLLLANIIGVVVFDKNKKLFEPFDFTGFKDVNPDNLNIFTVYIDKKNNIWFGTETGMFVVNETEKIYKHYTRKHGLPNATIKSILEDDHGNLWLGTNAGLIKFIDANGIPENPTFRKYSIEDGIQGNEFNYRSCYRNMQGTMYFGGVNGYNVFHPDSIHNNSNNVKVIITDFMLFNKPVEIGANESPLDKHISEKKELILNSRQNSFSFQYVAINFVSPEKNNYAYKLEGFDSEWNYVQNQREASYTNISPGKYRFMVKASNNAENWNNEPEIIIITISPPIWRTIWAYIFYGIILILIFFLFRKYSIIGVNRKNQLVIDQLSYSKQEEINQAKLHFFTNLSHEIRTPLTLISGPIEDIFTKVSGNIYFKDQLKLINQNIKRLSNLVNQLLDFRKIDTRGEILNASYHDLSHLINRIIGAFQYQKVVKKMQISFSNEEQIIAWFDVEKMTTILYNLIANAVKYNSENGKIEVEIKNLLRPPINTSSKWKSIIKKIKKDIEFIEVRIIDQGIGIHEDQLENIFDRYFQVFKSNSVWLRGTGIGLNITKDYIELHGGKIWVESDVGKGSCFIFQIPAGKDYLKPEEIVENYKEPDNTLINELLSSETIEAEDPGAIYSNPEIPDKSEKQMVLLVEDDSELVNYMEGKLQDDFLIIKAKNGLQGLDLAQKYDPDIIVTDIIMPEMDGVAMTMKLKSDLKTSHIPIIILTAKAYDESRIESIEKGADAYITKPFKTDLLKAYIITLLDSRKKLKEKYSQQLVLEPGEITINTIDEKFIKKLILVVEVNISDDQFDVSDLSSKMNLSYRVLARKVKSLTSQTVNEFIRSLRLKRAALILSKDNLPIAEVSALTGFSDPAYFSRCFQKQFGQAPTQYADTIARK